MIAGLAASASAQFLAPGMPMPGQAAQQQQQEPPCFKDFAAAEGGCREARPDRSRRAMKKKVSREEACTMIKSYSAAEAKIVKFIEDNAQTCGIPPQAATADEGEP